MTSRVMRSSGINKPVGVAGSWRFCAVDVSVRSLRRKFYIYICMQATRRVEIVLVNGLNVGVWLLTATDPYTGLQSSSYCSCFWSGAVNSHTVTEVTTDITDTPYRTGCHGAEPTWLFSVCAHAFSRLSTTVGSHGSRRRRKYVWILNKPKL